MKTNHPDYTPNNSLFLGTGNTVIKAVNVLKEHRVTEDNIILSNLFTTPIAAQTITTAFPLVCFIFQITFINLS